MQAACHHKRFRHVPHHRNGIKDRRSDEVEVDVPSLLLGPLVGELGYLLADAGNVQPFEHCSILESVLLLLLLRDPEHMMI